MWNDLLRATALMLVLEGILPFLAPSRARNLYASMAKLEPKLMRRLALASMLVGVASLQAMHWLG